MTTLKSFFDTIQAGSDTDTVRVVRNMSSRSKSQPCACIHCKFGRGMLSTEQDLACDLASHMFGQLVPTEVAQHILTTFVADGVLQVFEGEISHGEEPSVAPFDPNSEDVQRALAQAFEATKAHDCIRLELGETEPEEYSQPANQEEKEEKTYSFRWHNVPQEPFQRAGLVPFFNEITDRAFAAAKYDLTTTKLKLQHRFVAPDDNHRAVRLTFDPDLRNDEDPDFLLLPIQAFSDENLKTVDKRYINFSAARLVGVSTEELAESLDDMQSYAQGLKYAQPWVLYVLGMTISLVNDAVFFSRVDASGWEHLVLALSDGRGCLEFIRILLGLALSDSIALGQNPFISFRCEERTFQVSSTADSRASSDEAMSSSSDTFSDDSVPGSPRHNPVDNRDHSEIEMEDVDEGEESQSRENKTNEAMEEE